jgi:hypothetical protein
MEDIQFSNQQDNNTPINNNDSQQTKTLTTHQESEQDDKKFNKLNLPKRKYAIIHGYNGHNYSGNQK